VSWATDLSGGIQRVCLDKGVSPYGNGKARAVAWNLPDPMPGAPRADLLAPARPRRQVPDPPRRAAVPHAEHRILVQKATVEKNIAREFPIVLTSGRLVEYEGGGEETRSNRWLAELQQDMFVEINTADAADRGIKDGQWVWVMGAENGRNRGSRPSSPTASGGASPSCPSTSRAGTRATICAELSAGHRPDRARRERQHGHDLRLRPGDRHARDEVHALPDPGGVRRIDMARMKFLCDADAASSATPASPPARTSTTCRGASTGAASSR
jgi:hypothetical protein